MATVSYLSSIILPKQPTWRGTIQRYCINFSEWIFSFPMIRTSYEYTSELKLKEVNESTLKKTLRVMISLLFIFACKAQPLILALAFLPKIYNRHHLPISLKLPPPKSEPIKLPLVQKTFPELKNWIFGCSKAP